MTDVRRGVRQRLGPVVAIQRHQKTIGVLVVVDDDQVLVNNRRGAVAVLADERAQALAPDRHPVMTQSHDAIVGRRGPNDVNVPLVDRRAAGGKTVLPVHRMRFGGEFLLPNDLAVGRTQADQQPLAPGVGGAGHENPVSPKHGRTVPLAGQRDFPVVVGRVPGRRNRVGLALAAAVGPAKSGPLLGARRACGAAEQQQPQDGSAPCQPAGADGPERRTPRRHLLVHAAHDGVLRFEPARGGKHGRRVPARPRGPSA